MSLADVFNVLATGKSEPWISTSECWLQDRPGNVHEGLIRTRVWAVPSLKGRRGRQCMDYRYHRWTVLVPICQTCADLKQAALAVKFGVSVDALVELEAG